MYLNYYAKRTVDGNARYLAKCKAGRGMEDKFAVVTIDGARQEGQPFHHSGDQLTQRCLSVLKLN
ncbi:hypothetical protein OH492_05355 [Vibrio chagasii]|nr:hypothetical protein [Vibrio chagasii]